MWFEASAQRLTLDEINLPGRDDGVPFLPKVPQASMDGRGGSGAPMYAQRNAHGIRTDINKGAVGTYAADFGVSPYARQPMMAPQTNMQPDLIAAGCGTKYPDQHEWAGYQEFAQEPDPVPEPAPVPQPDPDWSMLGNEGDTVSVDAGTRVRYGYNGAYVERTFDAACTFTASNEFFGNDPAYGVRKVVELYVGAIVTPDPVPVPEPVPMPEPVPVPVPESEPVPVPVPATPDAAVIMDALLVGFRAALEAAGYIVIKK
jgi:hypothetical protein